MTRQTDDSGFLADIASMNKKGWAVEFKAEGSLVCCAFRRYDDVDVHRVSATGINHVEAFVATQESWRKFIEAEGGKAK